MSTPGQARRELLRRAALGRLARRLAHDFNNTLHLVVAGLDCLDTLADAGEPIERARPFLDSMRRAVLRGRTTLADLQPLLRAEPGTRPLAHAVLRLVALLRHTVPRLAVVLEPGSACTTLDLDEALLAEIVFLWIGQGGDAAQDLTLRTRSQPPATPADPPRVRLELAGASAPSHAETLLRELAALAGADLELAPATLALEWTACGTALLDDEVLVLIVGNGPQRAAAAHACSERGWAALEAAPEALDEVLEDYGDELEAAVLWPERPRALSGLQLALAERLTTLPGAPRLVVRDGHTVPDDLPRLVSEAVWAARLDAALRQPDPPPPK